MKHFLLEYHRPSRQLRSLIAYTDGDAAMRKRFALEQSTDSDTEVVVLTAQTLDTIQRTHSRYFGNVRTELQSGDRETLLGTLSWKPSDPLTVVIAAADVAGLAEKLTRAEWWRVDDLVSANGIRVDAWAEKLWNPDPIWDGTGPDDGTAWVRLHFTGYTLTCDLRRDIARDVAVGLTGASPVSVPVMFNCEPDDEDDLSEPVAVYFEAEASTTASMTDAAEHTSQPAATTETEAEQS
ncbi:hypothetical protein BKG82_28340 [Mycobacteroides chelonae]|uniref:Uncharacterized protein n=1 Tax=Mycobacteroides chelonae TaxID=1774 RepID=A0A1S1LFL4_MYCCH|nr:hypothetical protein BKG82_28340 [Mycobacteroides chelonae]